jgi:hypothetical protein
MAHFQQNYLRFITIVVMLSKATHFIVISVELPSGVGFVEEDFSELHFDLEADQNARFTQSNWHTTRHGFPPQRRRFDTFNANGIYPMPMKQQNSRYWFWFTGYFYPADQSPF